MLNKELIFRNKNQMTTLKSMVKKVVFSCDMMTVSLILSQKQCPKYRHHITMFFFFRKLSVLGLKKTMCGSILQQLACIFENNY